MKGVLRPTLNLGNSVIGVGILAMPYCIEKCGLVLGLSLLALSGTFTIWSLKMLVRSAQLTHKSSYEQLAYHTFGRHGKLVIEISIIGLAIGCLISFFIVIGDLAPPIVAKSLGISWSQSHLRIFLMTFLAFAVSLPLSLLRSVDSLSAVAISSLFFYSCLLIQVVVMSLSSMADLEVWKSVYLVKFEGLLHCLPICALALSCHPQMFVIYVQMADPSIRKMSNVISGAIYLVVTGYGIMAFFGYMNFVRDGVKGDVLTNFPHDGLSQLFRFGFSLSVVVSFPLVVFPVRASIYSLLFTKQQSPGADLHGAEPIPSRIFNTITVAIITGALIIAILVPNVESVLALTGATTGSIVSYIFPSLIFLSVVGSHAPFSNRAKFLAVLGVLVMVVGTATIVSEHMRGDESNSLPDSRDFPRPFVPKAKGPVIAENFNLKLPIAVAPKLPGLDGIPASDVIKDDVIQNDVIGDDVIRNEEVVPAVMNVPVVDEEVVKNEGVKMGGAEGAGLNNEHNSIRKDMEELKERVKAVEEENQELKDVLEMNQIEGKQLPEVRDHPEAPQPRDEAPPPVDGLSEDAGQPLGGAEPVGGVRAEPGDGGELGDGGGELGVIGDKEVERQSEKVVVDEEGVVGVNPPVGVAEEMKEGLVKREVRGEDVKREVRGEEEEEENGEKALDKEPEERKATDMETTGVGEKVTARELKSLKLNGRAVA